MKIALELDICDASQGDSEWIVSPRSHKDDWSVQPQRHLTSVSDDERQRQIVQLDAFRKLAYGWDSYKAEPPSETALANARRVLHCAWCSDIGSLRLSPSVEGGVGIIFAGPEKRYADIECFNDGEILAITSESASEPSVWSLGDEPGSIRKAIERIGKFLDG